MPFWYKGENIYLTLWLVNHYNPAWDGGTHIEYHYMAYDDAEVEYASLMRSGGYCFNSLSAEMLLTYFGMELMYELPRHRLPAFRTPYYTNDVRVDLLEADAVIELQDPEGNILGSAEDGNFYSLDHTQSYVLLVDGEASGVINFDNIYTDINVEVRKDFTAIEEIDANKAVASVVYYNLAGQQSEQPLDGVNIVVTTYTDGTRSTAKVIK